MPFPQNKISILQKISIFTLTMVLGEKMGFSKLAELRGEAPLCEYLHRKFAASKIAIAVFTADFTIGQLQ